MGVCDAEGPHSSAPALLQAAMQESLKQLGSVYTEAAQAGIPTPGAAAKSTTTCLCLSACVSVCCMLNLCVCPSVSVM